MDIKILKMLQSRPGIDLEGDYPKRNQGLSEAEIDKLETLLRETYYPELSSNECYFPMALRELLFLAGEYCYALDVSAETMWEQDAQVKMRLRRSEAEFTRPFFVIENYESSFIVYLDEAFIDPDLYIMDFAWNGNSQPNLSLLPIAKLGKTLNGLIKHCIRSYLER